MRTTSSWCVASCHIKHITALTEPLSASIQHRVAARRHYFISPSPKSSLNNYARTSRKAAGGFFTPTYKIFQPKETEPFWCSEKAVLELIKTLMKFGGSKGSGFRVGRVPGPFGDSSGAISAVEGSRQARSRAMCGAGELSHLRHCRRTVSLVPRSRSCLCAVCSRWCAIDGLVQGPTSPDRVPKRPGHVGDQVRVGSPASKQRNRRVFRPGVSRLRLRSLG